MRATALKAACEAALTHLSGGHEFVSREDVLVLLRGALSDNDQVYELPYPPSANAYWRSKTVFNKKTKRFIPLIHRSHEADDYRGMVDTLGKINGWTANPSYPVAIWIDVYRPKKIGDLDNTMKVMFDALKGRAFVDDDQIVEVTARRHDDKEHPRAVVRVAEAK